jgi:hypothetical protein
VILTADEVVALTRRDRPTAQARVLRALGIPFRLHPSDLTVLVSRTAVEAALGTISSKEVSSAEVEVYEVDFAGIRNHGKTSSAR